MYGVAALVTQALVAGVHGYICRMLLQYANVARDGAFSAASCWQLSVGVALVLPFGLLAAYDEHTRMAPCARAARPWLPALLGAVCLGYCVLAMQRLSATHALAPALGPAQAGGFENFSQFGNTGEDGADLYKLHVGFIGQQTGDRCFANTRRAPEY